MFNAFFTSVFSADDGLWDPGCPELEDHDGGKDKLPINPERMQDLLLHLDPHKSMGLDGIHHRVLLKSWLMSLWNLSQLFFNNLGNLERSQ